MWLASSCQIVTGGMFAEKGILISDIIDWDKQEREGGSMEYEIGEQGP